MNNEGINIYVVKDYLLGRVQLSSIIVLVQAAGNYTKLIALRPEANLIVAANAWSEYNCLYLA